MLRRRMGDERFFSMLAELAKRFDHKKVSTEDFRALAAQFLPPKAEDPKLEAFFEQWVYNTGIPALKINYTVKGKAPSLRVVGTIEQSAVDEDFSVLVPVEIQVARGRTITHWVQSGSAPASFSVAINQPPVKVALDPRRSILRR
jgi:aminopeptidase N